MTVAYISEFPIGDRSTENYEFLKEKLGDEKIDGLLVHTAGFDDDNGVWRSVDVWETREHADRFMARMMEMVGSPEDLPRPDTAAQRPTREGYYELHDFVKNVGPKPGGVRPSTSQEPRRRVGRRGSAFASSGGRVREWL